MAPTRMRRRLPGWCIRIFWNKSNLMKQTERCRQFGSIYHLTAGGGFTLIEVLVVMAIMVILFGMLFVPISTSIDMAREGQARTQMQQHLQMAMQRINRGLATAS
ncbi:MAG: prepilin-type N-terminal cleavage/methylation domain-containing protein, partial [Armatimonadetes bacterium]|nr:prepilin-type N-terminal cleavage/methylation domain-containing protein [Armatimonadota bacterium]